MHNVTSHRSVWLSCHLCLVYMCACNLMCLSASFFFKFFTNSLNFLFAFQIKYSYGFLYAKLQLNICTLKHASMSDNFYCRVSVFILGYIYILFFGIFRLNFFFVVKTFLWHFKWQLCDIFAS